MPVGYLITLFLLGACVLLLLAPVRKRPLGLVSFWGGLLVNEQAHWFAVLLAGSTVLAFVEGDISGVARAIAGLAVLAEAGLIVLFLRSFRSRGTLREALAAFDSDSPAALAGRRSYLAALAAPPAMGRSRVRLKSDIPYGPVPGRANRLDLYLPRHGKVTGPTMIYMHGGRFRSGNKRREAQAIKCQLARRGWSVISANYRLNPEGSFPDYLIDLKRVIAWARGEGQAFGIDPERIFLAGGSAGAHIAAMAGLTAGKPELQPGFEQVNTAVSGVIGIYGYYGGLESPGGRPPAVPSSPRRHVQPGAPPFLLIHGDHDSVVGRGGAAALVKELQGAGNQASLAVLPGAEHTFDLLRSVRTENTIDAIVDFVAWAEGSENRDLSQSRR